MRCIPLAFLVTMCSALSAQVIDVSPMFPHQGDTISIVYHAQLGNSALQGISPVYMHTGVLTTTSSGPSNWQYVQGNWGMADPNVLMSNSGSNTHKKTIHIPTFYGFPGTTLVTDLAFVFRNASGTLVGRNADGSDIFYPIYSSSSPLEVSWNCGPRLHDLLPGDSLLLFGEASKSTNLEIIENGLILHSDTASRNIAYTFHAPNQMGIHSIILKATDGAAVTYDTLIVAVNNGTGLSNEIKVLPAFPTLLDTVKVLFDASSGNAATSGISPLFMHSGLITLTGGAGNWQNVQGIWGTIDTNVQMIRLAKDIWLKEFFVAGFYGIPSTTTGVQKMAMVFRDSSGSIVGKTLQNQDIEYDLYPVPTSSYTAQFNTLNNQTFQINDTLHIQASASAPADISFLNNGVVMKADTNVYALQHSLLLGPGSVGFHEIIMQAIRNSDTVRDTLVYQVLGAIPVGGQILEVNPPFPNQNDTIQVRYYAKEGNGALKGVSPVFAHTGLITSASSSPSNWQNVQGNWGTADSLVWMSIVSSDVHEIGYSIPSFYGFNTVSTTVQQLAFVFRDSTGNLVGRDYGGQDIYYPISPLNGGFEARFFRPQNSIVLQQGQCIQLEAKSNEPATISFYDNGQLIATDSAAQSLNFCQVPAPNSGNHLVEMVAISQGGDVQRDTIQYVFVGNLPKQDPPVTWKNGANYLNDSTLGIKLYAPGKSHVYLLAELNNFQPDADFQLHQSLDGNTFWKTINVTAGQPFVYQYLVDGILRIADPFSERIIDPQNDGQISANTYPNPYPYPSGKTSGHLSLVHPGRTPYTWDHPSFQAVNKEDLIIYELLVRDFVAPRNYQTLTDSVGYLAKLNVNAVEFMPINEFENNLSWGYNPSYHMALDKYYGTPDAFKELIDSLHGRGIAVIIDVVFNHAEGQNPLVQLWFDAGSNAPTADNPYFNAQCPHPPNCWGFDMNHESQATKDYVDQILRYWVEEYHVDGFRLDFTKGFTNGAGGGWDVGRQNLLKRIANQVWSYKPNCYMILEHWGDNAEEIVLSNHGFLLWGNEVHQYQEATMGFSGGSNFSTAYHGNRGWGQPHLVTYMESHDEERIGYKNLAFGNNSIANHNVRTTPVSMERMELGFLFSHLIPGPKMMYQFQELGYDISIDNPCRVCVKPLKWNYYSQLPRRRLYETVGIINGLKSLYPTFGTQSNFYSDLYGHVKQLGFIHSSMDAVVVGNFDVATQSKTINFSHTGTWYEYFSGQTLSISNNQTPLQLQAGEYRLYTDVFIPRRVSTFNSSENEVIESAVFPNPTNDIVYIIDLEGIKSIKFSDNLGRAIDVSDLNSNYISLKNIGFKQGIIHIQILRRDGTVEVSKIVLIQ